MGYRLPFFPMYAAETLADGRFQGWNLEERGAWITLLCLNWNDGDIPSAPSTLARLLGVGPGDMARIWSAIGDRFSPAPGKPDRMVCPRLEDERDKAEALSLERSKAGKKGAKARWNSENPDDGKRMRLPRQTHGKANATAMRPQCPQPSPSPPSEPSPPSTTVQERSIVLPMPARRRAGATKLGEHSSALVARVEAGLGKGLLPLKTEAEADELEALTLQWGEERAFQFIAGTCRDRDNDPKSVAWLLAVLRPSSGVRQ